MSMNSASFAAARIGCRRSAFDHVAAVVQDEDDWRGTRFEKTGDVLVHLVTRLGSLNNDILNLAETAVGRFDQWLSLFMVGSAVFATAWFFVLPGLFLLARWALFIPVIVLERKGAFAALGRSNALVRRHTARVMLELVASTLYMFVVWSIAVGLLQGITSPWVSIPATVAFVAVVTPVIPLMRTLSYYDLCSRERLAADSPSAAAIASET